MLRRSLGASSFAGFWRYWNPLWGYYLGRYSFEPLRRVLPRWLALILTFVLCGFLHDLVIMAVRGSVVLFATPWFVLLGSGVVMGEIVGMDTSRFPWAVRAAINVAYVAGSFVLTIAGLAILQKP